MKLVSESRVTWATFVPILVFLGLSVFELGPMYATDRRQTKASLNASAYGGGGIITELEALGQQPYANATHNPLGTVLVICGVGHHKMFTINYCPYPAMVKIPLKFPNRIRTVIWISAKTECFAGKISHP